MSGAREEHPPFLTGRGLQAPHALFCRHGGVSGGVFASLNLSYSVGDDPERVRENRARALAALGLPRLVSLGQVHGDRILAIKNMPEREAYPQNQKYHGYDAAISKVPGLALLILQADCQAVLLHDPAARVVAAAHCGWRGSVAGIVGKTVARMREDFAVEPGRLRALIAPSLGPCCAEFLHYARELPAWMWAYQAEKPAHFDFWAITRRQLADAGVPPEHIETTGICTRCDRNFFSFRRAKLETGGLCGRHGAMIGLAA